MRSAGTSADRRTARHRVVAAVLVVVAALVTAGCDLRLETPPPAPLVPDQLEQIRQRAGADALALQVLALEAAVQAPDEAVRAAVESVGAASTAHLAALGGVYDPSPESADGGPDGSSTTPADETDASATDAGVTDAGVTDIAPSPEASEPGSPTATPGPPPAVTPQTVVDLLVETAASARADASASPDGRLARLLCSITVSRVLLAESLQRAAGLTPGLAAEDPLEQPTTTGLSPGDLVALVQSEDALGLAWEVTAGRTADDVRQHAADRAQAHRSRAEAWAQAAAIAATGLDPRRSWYDLPTELTTVGTDATAAQAALAALEGALAADYASLVASADTTARSTLIDAALEASREEVALGSPLATFPGLPEQA